MQEHLPLLGQHQGEGQEAPGLFLLALPLPADGHGDLLPPPLPDQRHLLLPLALDGRPQLVLLAEVHHVGEALGLDEGVGVGELLAVAVLLAEGVAAVIAVFLGEDKLIGGRQEDRKTGDRKTGRQEDR